MLLVKTYAGDGVWDLYEAYDQVTYLGPNCVVDIPAEAADAVPGEAGHWSALDDQRFPDAAIVHACIGTQTPHVVGGTDEPDRKRILVGWATWRDPEGRLHLLVHDDRTFIMNGDGETIEVIW